MLLQSKFLFTDFIMFQLLCVGCPVSWLGNHNWLAVGGLTLPLEGSNDRGVHLPRLVQLDVGVLAAVAERMGDPGAHPVADSGLPGWDVVHATHGVVNEDALMRLYRRHTRAAREVPDSHLIGHAGLITFEGVCVSRDLASHHGFGTFPLTVLALLAVLQVPHCDVVKVPRVDVGQPPGQGGRVVV